MNGVHRSLKSRGAGLSAKKNNSELGRLNNSPVGGTFSGGTNVSMSS
jgi:hypothetical protein